jgi:hypothetical protein
MHVRGGSAVLREVSRQILEEATVICFDEMQVGELYIEKCMQIHTYTDIFFILTPFLI